MIINLILDVEILMKPDAVERYHLDIGEEWPEGEDSGVARYRKFYQVC